MSHLHEPQLQELKDALEAEGITLEQELATIGKKDARGDWTGSSNSIQEEESEPVDIAENNEELGTNVAVVEELEKKQRDVVDALDRMDTHEYGICEECGDDIPYERLVVNPSARTCINCA
jgi:RNA polymerase-binding transcription factor DksA